ncbi:hypothetical protein I4U23_026247 [Adineta vaga]|nr:hypothetical protein I4U23_026247 [Adineta vaga]
MPGVAAILHAPALFLRIFLNVAAGSAGVSVVAATVVIGVVIVGKMTDPPHPGDDHFRDTTIILQSSASIAFNRIIQVYEMDVYYNATEALLDLSKRLNDHLKQKFPRMFVKAVTSGFSLKPQTDVSRRKRRYPYCHECLLKLLAENAAREKRDSSSVDHGDIDIASIIDALKSFNPIIELADKCIKKSPDTSSFNATLSKVEPPYKVEVDLSFLKEDNTIPPSLLSQANSIIPPIVIAENGTTTTTPTPTPTPTTATSTITTGTPVVG